MLIPQHLLERMLFSLDLPNQKISGRIRMKIMKTRKNLHEHYNQYREAQVDVYKEFYHFADDSVVMEDGEPLLKEGFTQEDFNSAINELAETEVEVHIDLFNEEQYMSLDSESEDLILLVNSKFNPLLPKKEKGA